MSLDLDIVGQSLGEFVHEWTATDAQLYALGVGCGQPDPQQDLAYTTENSTEVTSAILPTFPLLCLEHLPLERLGSFGLSQVIHAEQGIRIHTVLPVAGSARVRPRVTALLDKGTAALIEIETYVSDGESGDRLATLMTGIYLRGEGGFDGVRGTSDSWQGPTRVPDHTVDFQTRPEQALLYRLSGDRNPLHSDPTFAREAGFSRPILHGLCTLGFAARALLLVACEDDPQRFGSMHVRFSHPVFPGDTLRTVMWDVDEQWLFQTRSGDDSVVIDRGVFTLR